MIRFAHLSVFLIITLSASGQAKFHTIEADSLDLMAYLKGSEPTKEGESQLDGFEVSELITWRDYKEFLFEVRRTKGEFYFNLFLPKLPDGFAMKALNSKDYDKDPVTGVSWTSSQEYCKWRTMYDNEYTFDFYYRIPSIDDWLFVHHGNHEKMDINDGVAEWTSSAKLDMVFSTTGSKNKAVGHNFIPKESDPPSLKRKYVMGKSAVYTSDKLLDYCTLGYYQDSSYSNVGFRIIKVAKAGLQDDYSDWFCDYIDKFDPWLFGTENTIKNEKYIYEVYENNGVLDGLYTSYYANGNLKAFGYFYENQRLGTWTVYDTLGQKIQERTYTGPGSFKVTYPKEKKSSQQELKDSRQIYGKRDKSGMIVLPEVRENNVYMSQRYEASITAEHNSVLFRNDRLYSVLKSAFEKDSITCYDTTQWFKTPLSFEEFNARIKGNIVRFDVVSDFFFDISRNCADTRILGICPVTRDSVTNEEIRVGWFYFPGIRKELRQEYIPNAYQTASSRTASGNFPDGKLFPSNLDDHMVMRHFQSDITKVYTYYSNGTEIPGNSDLDPFYFIELEHDLWMEVGYKPKAGFFKRLFGKKNK